MAIMHGGDGAVRRGRRASRRRCWWAASDTRSPSCQTVRSRSRAWSCLRASIIRLTQLAISPSTSAKSHLEGRERGREKRTGASSSAGLQHKIRELCARLQPVASARAGALDPLRLSRLPRFSFLLRARKSARAVAPNSFLAPNQAFQISPNRHLSRTLELSPAHIKEMGQQSKRTRAPAPREAPPPAPLLTPPPAHLLVPPPAHLLVPPPAHLLVSPAPKSTPPPGIPPAFPSKQRTSTWIPTRPQESLAASLQQPSESGPTAQGPCWAPPACIGDSTSPWYMAGNMDYSDPQVGSRSLLGTACLHR
ncbi:hypothetical protein CFC21_047175 [Triticum aestivum]|uniref:Uncharacterized protein n=2 Tax=Triticum aestivum TaxID=4565 RepID=A0A3B6GVW1_WHEAT|nr:pistil-specific extensin-like protein isoform X2 [Triticum aestivum]KAF7036542.1 hypothetical protein CFC21_047175 [Triticum aestivum]